MENLPGIPTGTINMIKGKSIAQKDYLVRFTPKNHPRCKRLEMKEGDFMIEVPLVDKLGEHSIFAINEMINKVKVMLKTEISAKVEIENINGINYPVTYLEDGIIIVDYPII